MFLAFEAYSLRTDTLNLHAICNIRGLAAAQALEA